MFGISIPMEYSRVAAYSNLNAYVYPGSGKGKILNSIFFEN